MKPLNVRQKKIISLLNDYETLTVSELSSLTESSEATIRRDLIILSEQNLIDKFHGGAKSISTKILNYIEQHNQLSQLAYQASLLVDEGDVIFINSSLTAVLMLTHIIGKQITVITNNPVAIDLNLDKHIELILLGGMIMPTKKSIVGHFATDMLSNITANKCFLGVSALNAAEGLGTTVFQETTINKMFLDRCSGEKVVIAESSKFGKECNFISAQLKDITQIITDTNCSKQDEAAFISAGVKLTKVKFQ